MDGDTEAEAVLKEVRQRRWRMVTRILMYGEGW